MNGQTTSLSESPNRLRDLIGVLWVWYFYVDIRKPPQMWGGWWGLGLTMELVHGMPKGYLPPDVSSLFS